MRGQQEDWEEWEEDAVLQAILDQLVCSQVPVRGQGSGFGLACAVNQLVCSEEGAREKDSLIERHRQPHRAAQKASESEREQMCHSAGVGGGGRE